MSITQPTMPTISFVTYTQAPNLTEDDAIAVEPLRRRGIEVVPCIWNDPAVEWTTFDLVVVRSCWDYYFQPEEFAAWLDRLEAANVKVWNPIAVMRWNMSKEYLEFLAVCGIATPPTVWIPRGPAPDLHALMRSQGFTDVVIKPTVSAAAWRTWRLSIDDAAAFQPRFEEAAQSFAMIVQQYLPEIETEGEWSLIFFMNEFSHAVRKRPAKGDFRVQHEFGGTYEAAHPSEQLIGQASDILRCVDMPLLYARVDGVVTEKGFLLIELELIEPQLFFPYDPAAPERFAECVVKMLG